MYVCNYQVLSGDAVVIRGQPRGGPPQERTLAFSNVSAPRLARRPNPNNETSETKDEVRSQIADQVYMHDQILCV